jgi:signal transduction histidine kinase
VEGIMDGIADTPEKRDKYIKTIYNKTKEMEQLIGELTLYYKIDSNNIPFRFEKISANQYFEDCSKDLLLYLETKGIDFQYQNELKDDINVIIDPEQLRRVISNIMTNSVKYMDKDKPRHTLKMRIKEVQDMVQLEITDNGVGIAKKDMPYVFERFFRGDASRSTSSGGSGIGLSIVKRIVEVHGGKVFITSDIRKGTTVYIMIRKDQEGVSNE